MTVTLEQAGAAGLQVLSEAVEAQVALEADGYTDELIAAAVILCGLNMLLRCSGPPRNIVLLRDVINLSGRPVEITGATRPGVEAVMAASVGFRVALHDLDEALRALGGAS